MVQKNYLNKKILIICGPTASSKTALAVECAKRLNSEVISADSMCIYKGLNIGTAKPTEVETCGIPHHMIDVVAPTATFSVGDYKDLASPIVDGLIEKGKIPIICGGTGFYINSILYDFSYGLGVGNMEIREKYKKLAEEKGNLFVYDILKAVDPESAEKLHYNDLKRVIRALEIFENGKKKSEIKDDLTPKYDFKAYSVDYPREILYKRIEQRVDEMLKRGLIDEVGDLLDSGVTEDMQCMQGIGYKEVISYLNGELSLKETADLIKLNTRHYAKRQITFFKKLNGLKTIQPDDVQKMAEYIVENL